MEDSMMEERIRQRIMELEQMERQVELNLHAIRAARGELRAILEEPEPTITEGEDPPEEGE